jgi:DNA-binding NarL/FixJ family response regulator
MTTPALPLQSLRILRLLNRGRSLDDIAQQLEFTVGTVNEYLKRMYRLFSVATRQDLIAEARKVGVVDTPKHSTIRPRWLTPARLEVLRLAQKGINYREIADRLGKERDAVDKMLQYIRDRLDVSSTSEALEAIATMGFLRQPRVERPVNPIAPREHDILDRLALGRTAREIADDLGLSRNSIDGRLRRLRAKLRVADNESLLVAARETETHYPGRRRKRVSAESLVAIGSHKALMPLTARELEVLDLLLRHPQWTNHEFAAYLNIADGTFEAHVYKLLRFYAVEDRWVLLTVVRQQGTTPSRAALPSGDHVNA